MSTSLYLIFIHKYIDISTCFRWSRDRHRPASCVASLTLKNDQASSILYMRSISSHSSILSAPPINSSPPTRRFTFTFLIGLPEVKVCRKASGSLTRGSKTKNPYSLSQAGVFPGRGLAWDYDTIDPLCARKKCQMLLEFCDHQTQVLELLSDKYAKDYPTSRSRRILSLSVSMDQRDYLLFFIAANIAFPLNLDWGCHFRTI